jgi:hypothetical protein
MSDGVNLTTEQWRQVEVELASTMGRVKLVCDGYPVTLVVQPYKPLKFGIFFFVDGVFEGKWMVNDCEQRRRFFQRMEGFLHNKKERDTALKIFGGKRAKKSDIEWVNKKFIHYRHFWLDAKALRRHFQKNNQSIELLKLGY